MEDIENPGWDSRRDGALDPHVTCIWSVILLFERQFQRLWKDIARASGGSEGSKDILYNIWNIILRSGILPNPCPEHACNGSITLRGAVTGGHRCPYARFDFDVAAAILAW